MQLLCPFFRSKARTPVSDTAQSGFIQFRFHCWSISETPGACYARFESCILRSVQSVYAKTNVAFKSDRHCIATVVPESCCAELCASDPAGANLVGGNRPERKASDRCDWHWE